MKIGYIFPGQGSQSIGMGKDIHEKYEEVKDLYKKVKEITNIDIAKISFEGPEELLNQTQYTQLAVLTESLAILKILNKNKIKAEITAGLSLGEYTALIYSKCLDFEDGIKIVKKRGEFMQNMVPKGEWLMAAILGMNENQVEEICNKVEDGFVVPANYNSTGQIVISGEKDAVKKACEIAKETGARKTMILKTAGPFHTKKLIESSKALKIELDKISLNNFEIPVIKNIDGNKYDEKDDIKEILEKHIISPVRFSKIIETMLKEGIDTFVEVGPGKTLSGFVKRAKTDKEIKILNINDIESLEATIKYLKEER